MATDWAENKLVQLEAAKKVGFKVPLSLVTQDESTLTRFLKSVSGRAVVKAVRTFAPIPLLTVNLEKQHLSSKRDIRLCPTLYQENISGNRHIRAHVLGDKIVSVIFESANLDWRKDHADLRNMKPFIFDKKTHSRLIRLCKNLQLEMGICDFKVTASGDIVFLDLNPQGQFLFVQGMTRIDLTTEFAKFLCERAQVN